MSVMRVALWGLLWCVWSVSGQVQAAEAPWEPVRLGDSRDSIRTWVRPVDGLQVKAFRGMTELPHTTLAVLALIADVPQMHKWAYQCRVARQIKTRAESQTYTRFRGIWPASDRDVLIDTQVRQQADGSIVVESRHVADFPLSDDVRIPYLHNTLRLTPLKGRWTRIELETQVDPGGMIPAWLANLVAIDAPLHTLAGMQRQLAAQPRYQIKSVNQLPAYYQRHQPLVIPDEHLAAEPAAR